MTALQRRYKQFEDWFANLPYSTQDCLHILAMVLYFGVVYLFFKLLGF